MELELRGLAAALSLVSWRRRSRHHPPLLFQFFVSYFFSFCDMFEINIDLGV